MAEFDPSQKSVDEVLKYLSTATKTERNRVLAAETAGKKRKTVLEEYGIDPDARFDASGRQLYPWEVAPDEAIAVEVEETDEARKAREAQAELDATVAATPQGGGAAGGGGTITVGGGGSGGVTPTPSSPTATPSSGAPNTR